MLDPRSDETLLELAPDLAALGAHPTFLADHIVAAPHDARLEGAMRLLRVLGHRPGAKVTAALASHEAHFVRWTAIRYTTALDPEEGRRLLQQATTDPHPHVRRAAERALARITGAASKAR